MRRHKWRGHGLEQTCFYCKWRRMPTLTLFARTGWAYKRGEDGTWERLANAPKCGEAA